MSFVPIQSAHSTDLFYLIIKVFDKNIMFPKEIKYSYCTNIEWREILLLKIFNIYK